MKCGRKKGYIKADPKTRKVVPCGRRVMQRKCGGVYFFFNIVLKV